MVSLTDSSHRKMFSILFYQNQRWIESPLYFRLRFQHVHFIGRLLVGCYLAIREATNVQFFIAVTPQNETFPSGFLTVHILFKYCNIRHLNVENLLVIFGFHKFNCTITWHFQSASNMNVKMSIFGLAGRDGPFALTTTPNNVVA
jgi:hypothetical protein